MGPPVEQKLFGEIPCISTYLRLKYLDLICCHQAGAVVSGRVIAILAAHSLISSLFPIGRSMSQTPVFRASDRLCFRQSYQCRLKRRSSMCVGRLDGSKGGLCHD